MVVAEARLQQVISGPARATVTSVYGLATEIVALAVYGSFAVAAGVLSVPSLVALLGIPIVLVAWGVARRLPEPRRRWPRGFFGRRPRGSSLWAWISRLPI